MAEMKDSGVEWIGEIPEDWKILKIKQTADISIENSFVDGDWIESPYIEEEGIRYLTTGNIGDGIYKDQGSGYISYKTFTELKCKYAYADDLVFSRLNAPYGRSCLLPFDFDKYVVAVDNVILKPTKEYCKKYICYVSQCEGYQHSVEDNVKGTTMKRISRTNLGNIKIPVPNIEKQVEIITFLDGQISDIDSIIENTKTTIEDYKKYKQRTIINATTKGLNTNVTMKDIDSDWIGSIPAHWDYVRIQRLFETVDERNEEENACLLSLYTAIGVKPRSELEEKGNKAVTVLNYKKVQKNDIIVNKLLAWMGAIGYSDYEGVTSPDYDVYRAKEGANVNRSYYNNYFRYTCFNGDCYKYGHGIMLMRWRTYPEEFLRIKVPNPPVEEQREIAEYLDIKCAEIDKLIASKEALVEELEAYKKSIIYEYVTGKKEVL